MKVFFLSNIPSPYNIAYLEELGKLAVVEAVFEKATATDRDESWSVFDPKHFKISILNGIRVSSDKAFCANVCKYIKEHKGWKIVIGNPFTPTGLIAALYCILKKIPYILQSEGGFPGGSNPLKEKIKKIIITHATLCFSGMSYPNDYFLYYGATKDRVVNYPFTSLYDHQILKEKISNEEKSKLKIDFSIPYEKVIVSVGRMMEVKGFDVLVKSFKKVESTVTGLYIIGGEPDEKLRKLIVELGVNNIHFIEFMDHDSLIDFFKASDIFVLATRGDTWGLVVNEAMSTGLPVITTDKCVAGNELIKSGVNGFSFKCDNVDELTSDIQILLDDMDLCDKIGRRGLTTIQAYSYENMALVIYKALEGK